MSYTWFHALILTIHKSAIDSFFLYKKELVMLKSIKGLIEHEMYV